MFKKREKSPFYREKRLSKMKGKSTNNFINPLRLCTFNELNTTKK